IFLGKLSRMLSSDFVTFMTADRVTQIGQDACRFTVVVRSPLFDKPRRFLYPDLRIGLDLEHSNLSQLFSLVGFPLGFGLRLSLLFLVFLLTKSLTDLQELPHGANWPFCGPSNSLTVVSNLR